MYIGFCIEHRKIDGFYPRFKIGRVYAVDSLKIALKIEELFWLGPILLIHHVKSTRNQLQSDRHYIVYFFANARRQSSIDMQDLR